MSAEKTMAGIDASRRAGWAKFYDTQEDLAAVENLAVRRLAVSLSFAYRIAHHDRLPSSDPLVVDAMALIEAVESDPEGRVFALQVKAAALRSRA
jgi:hypothetical protein